MLGGVGLGIWLTGKLGRAWHRCVGGACAHGLHGGGACNYLAGSVVGLVRLDLWVGVGSEGGISAKLR